VAVVDLAAAEVRVPAAAFLEAAADSREAVTRLAAVAFLQQRGPQCRLRGLPLQRHDRNLAVASRAVASRAAFVPVLAEAVCNTLALAGLAYNVPVWVAAAFREAWVVAALIEEELGATTTHFRVEMPFVRPVRSNAPRKIN
jgi:hypothetical protein